MIHSTKPKFEWLSFWEYFDISDISKTQGDYQKGLDNAFNQLETDDLKSRLLNLLDLQLIIQLELIYANNEYWEAQLEKAAPIRCHTTKSFKVEDPLKPTDAEIQAFFAHDPDDSHSKERALRDEIEAHISYRYDTLHARLGLNEQMRSRYSLPGRGARFAKMLNLYLENEGREKLTVTSPTSRD